MKKYSIPQGNWRKRQEEKKMALEKEIEIHEPVKLKVFTDVEYTPEQKTKDLTIPEHFNKTKQKLPWYATDRRIIYHTEKGEADLSYEHVIQTAIEKAKAVSLGFWGALGFKSEECFCIRLKTQIGSVVLTGSKAELKKLSQIIREEKENIIKMVTAKQVQQQTLGSSSRAEEIQNAIERLAKLTSDGYITMEEFTQKKKDLLNQI